jgi:hypothetical protein
METKYPTAANWKNFESFGWHNQPENPELWTIWYYVHRDSGLLAQSNAAEIEKRLEPFTETKPETLRLERHNHWAVGWIDGVSVRIGSKAYDKLCLIIDDLEDYPILNEGDYSEREWEATRKNIKDAVRYVRGANIDTDLLPEGFEDKIAQWFEDSGNYGERESQREDQGGYPSDEALINAVSALWPKAIEIEDQNRWRS